MKVTTFVINLCSVFIFLTVGSLLTIIAFHLVSFQDIVYSVEGAYRDPWRLIQLGALGFLMIVLGLAFTKTLIKSTEGSALVYESRNGQIRVSSEAIQELVRKTLKKYTVIKEQRSKVTIDYENVHVKVKLVLWTGVKISEFLRSAQDELYGSLSRLLGPDSKIQIVVDVAKVISHEPEMVVHE